MVYVKTKTYKETIGNTTYYNYGGFEIDKIIGNYEYENELYFAYDGSVNDEDVTLISKDVFDNTFAKLKVEFEREEMTLNDKVKTLEEQNTMLENAILDLANIVGGVE